MVKFEGKGAFKNTSSPINQRKNSNSKLDLKKKENA